jgi:hypothetical protein
MMLTLHLSKAKGEDAFKPVIFNPCKNDWFMHIGLSPARVVHNFGVYSDWWAGDTDYDLLDDCGKLVMGSEQDWHTEYLPTNLTPFHVQTKSDMTKLLADYRRCAIKYTPESVRAAADVSPVKTGAKETRRTSTESSAVLALKVKAANAAVMTFTDRAKTFEHKVKQYRSRLHHSICIMPLSTSEMNEARTKNREDRAITAPKMNTKQLNVMLEKARIAAEKDKKKLVTANNKIRALEQKLAQGGRGGGINILQSPEVMSRDIEIGKLRNTVQQNEYEKAKTESIVTLLTEKNEKLAADHGALKRKAEELDSEKQKYFAEAAEAKGELRGLNRFLAHRSNANSLSPSGQTDGT